jgi:hypothetical protein
MKTGAACARFHIEHHFKVVFASGAMQSIPAIWEGIASP